MVFVDFFRFVKSGIKEERLRRLLSSKFPGLSYERYVTWKGDFANLVIEGRAQIQAGTNIHLGGMDWCEGKGCLIIGDGAVVSPNCVIYACGPGGVTIGRNFDCGPHVGIYASRTNYHVGPGQHLFAPIVVGDDVTIFANCVISPGVNIGEKAVVAAGSVVTSDIPPNCLYGGSPAKLIKNLEK